MIVIRDSKNFDFHFDWPKDFDKNLKHEIEFLRKSNEPLAENKMINQTEQLLSTYKRGNKFMNMEKSKMNEPHKNY